MTGSVVPASLPATGAASSGMPAAPLLRSSLDLPEAGRRLAGLAAGVATGLRVDDLWNLTVPPDWVLTEPMAVDNLRLHVVKGGQGTYVVDGTRFAMRRGLVMLLHPRLAFTHDVNRRDPVVLMSLHVSFPGLTADAPGWWLAAEVGDEAAAWCELADDLYQAQTGGDAWERAHAVPALLTLALARLRRLCQAGTGPAFDVRVEALRDHLQRYPEDGRPLSVLAAMQGLSGDHLARLFRRQVGVSPQQYRLRVVMDRARLLLEQTGASVGTVAERFGYADQFVFSRLFRRVHGRPPSAFHARRQSV